MRDLAELLSMIQDVLEHSNPWALFDKLAVSDNADAKRAVSLAIRAVARQPIPDAQRDKWKTLVRQPAHQTPIFFHQVSLH